MDIKYNSLARWSDLGSPGVRAQWLLPYMVDVACEKDQLLLVIIPSIEVKLRVKELLQEI